MSRPSAQSARRKRDSAPGIDGSLISLATARRSDDDANWWMITLSDLTLLMLGFMVVWYVTGKTPVAPQAAKQAISHAARGNEITQLLAVPSDAAETMQTVQQDMLKFIRAAGFAKAVTVESMPNGLVLSLQDTVPFASGKADLRARAMPILEKVAAILLGNPHFSVAVSGHTDSLRVATPEFPSNWELSAARASRVARYLVERGIHPARISVQGYANYRPRKPNSTPSNRSSNRRVEIRLSNDVVASGDESQSDHR